MVRFVLLMVAVAAAVAVALGSSAASPERHRGSTRTLTRYSLVHGCYQLRARPGGRPIAAKRGPFRMQAAALGVYLLWGRHRDYLIASESSRRKLRYLTALLAKEIVLHSFPHPQHATVLERMVEVLTITERRHLRSDPVSR